MLLPLSSSFMMCLNRADILSLSPNNDWTGFVDSRCPEFKPDSFRLGLSPRRQRLLVSWLYIDFYSGFRTEDGVRPHFRC